MTTLVLLVGRNPLPNAVSALWLQRQPGVDTVLLMHSPEVFGEAQRTRTLMKGHGLAEPSIFLISVNPAYSANTTAEKIKDSVGRYAPKTDLHINYTGGTKAMGLGARRAAEALASGHPSVTLSYLDDRPGRHYLRECKLNQEGSISAWTSNPPASEAPSDLRNRVALGLDELLDLHFVLGSKRKWEPFTGGPRRQAYRTKLVGALEAARVQSLPDWRAAPEPAMLKVGELALHVVTLVGYQLYACNVAEPDRDGDDDAALRSRKEVKHTAFTSLMFARRLGGEEARVCVASDLTAPDAQDLERDLFLFDGGSEKSRRVKILDRNTMQDDRLLREAMEDFLT